MSINISDVFDIPALIKMIWALPICFWIFLGGIIPIIWLRKNMITDDESLTSLIEIPVLMVSALIAAAILVVLGLITSPLGGDPVHRCSIIATSIIMGVPTIGLIKEALTNRVKETSVESNGTVTIKSTKKEEIPGQLNMSKSQVRKIKNNQKRYKKHK